MPAKNTKNNKKQTKPTFLRQVYRAINRHRIITLLIIFVLGIAIAGFGYKTITNFQDERTAQQYKKQLDQIDKEMAVEFDKIVNQSGEPDLRMHEKLCHYPSSDGDPGPPTCGPFYRASYKFTDIKASNEFIKLSKGLVEANTKFELEDLGMFPHPDPLYISRDLIDTYDTKNAIRCSYDIVRGTSDYDRPQGTLPRHFYVYHNYDCSKGSPKPIYREVNK